MKKLLLTLGSAASIAAPLVTVIACGDEDTPTTDAPDNGTDGGGDNGSGGDDNGTDGGGDTEGGDDALSKPLQINGADYIPTEDEVIMMDEYYKDGILWDGQTVADGSEVTNGYVQLWSEDKTGYNRYLNGYVSIDTGDSVVIAYDEDDEDGLAINNATDTVSWINSTISLANNPAEATLNESLGHVPHGMGGYEIAFNDKGMLLPYLTDEFNDDQLPLIDALDIIDADYDDEVLNKFLTHYGYMKDSNGDIVDDSAVVGEDPTIVPVVASDGWMTSEQIAKNAIKITFNNPYSDNEFGNTSNIGFGAKAFGSFEAEDRWGTAEAMPISARKNVMVTP